MTSLQLAIRRMYVMMVIVSTVQHHLVVCLRLAERAVGSADPSFPATRTTRTRGGEGTSPKAVNLIHSESTLTTNPI